MSLLLTTALFVALSPGVLLTIPPGKGPLFVSGKTSLVAVFVHAVVFYVVQAYLAQYVPWWGIWIAAVVLVGLRMYMSRPAVPTYGY